MLAKLADRAQISELLSRYCSFVDDKCFNIEAVKATFTPDGRYVRPNGSATVGHEAIASEAKTFSRFRGMQHITSDHIIDLEGNTARLRANMIAMHLWSEEENDPRSLQTHFVAGGVFEAVAVRTADGWRFKELKSRITWRAGSGMSAVARIGSPGN
ncbi:MAG: nuclear transport factor 2 family protein [Thermoactinomyces sp.]